MAQWMMMLQLQADFSRAIIVFTRCIHFVFLLFTFPLTILEVDGMAAAKTIFLYKLGVVHFHDCCKEGILLYPILMWSTILHDKFEG